MQSAPAWIFQTCSFAVPGNVFRPAARDAANARRKIEIYTFDAFGAIAAISGVNISIAVRNGKNVIIARIHSPLLKPLCGYHISHNNNEWIFTPLVFGMLRMEYGRPEYHF